MDDDDNKPPRGILFLLEDGSEWAHMLPREEMKPRPVDEDPPFEMIANIIIPPNPRLH